MDNCPVCERDDCDGKCPNCGEDELEAGCGSRCYYCGYYEDSPE